MLMQLKGALRNPIVGTAFDDGRGWIRWKLDPSFTDWVWGIESRRPRELWLQMRVEDLEPAPRGATVTIVPPFTRKLKQAMLAYWLDEMSVDTLDVRTAVDVHDHITPEPRSIHILHLHHYGTRAIVE